MAFKQKTMPRPSTICKQLSKLVKTGSQVSPAYQLMAASLRSREYAIRHGGRQQVTQIAPDNAQIYRFMGSIQQDYEQWEDAKRPTSALKRTRGLNIGKKYWG